MRVFKRFLFVVQLNLPAFENKKYTALDRFHGNGPYGKIPTKKEPIKKIKHVILTCEDMKFSRESSLGISLVFMS